MDSLFIYNTGKYQLQQDASQGNPYYTYSGEEYIHIATPIPLQIMTSMKALSLAEGRWACRTSPDLVTRDSRVKLSFLAEDVHIEKLAATDNGPIAELEIKLIPELNSN